MFSRRVIATPAFVGAVRFNATAAAAPAAAAGNPKIQTLMKILLGEVAFKNKALLKQSNVEAMFGPTWRNELEAYAMKNCSDAEKHILCRQVDRLCLTRYTIRELAMFATKGAENVDAAANAFMVAEAKKMIAAKGEAAFLEHVKAEAKLANWSDEAVKKFIDEVKNAKK